MWTAVPRTSVALFALLAGLGLGCADTSDDDSTPGGDDDVSGDDDDDDDDDEPPCSEVFNLELVPIDIWGFDLPVATMRVLIDGEEHQRWIDHVGSVRVPLQAGGTFRFEIGEADEFIPAAATLTWDGGALPDALSLEQPDEEYSARALHAYEIRKEDGRKCPTASLFLGLDHQWFAATARPARQGNDLTLLLNGENSWASLHQDLLTAEDRIHHSVWYWVSQFEMVRPTDHVWSTQLEREQYAAMTLLEQQPATKRLLVNRFYDGWDWIDTLYTDSRLLSHAQLSGDDFEVMLHSNDTDVPLESEYEGEPADFCFRDRLLANPAYADVPLLDPPCHTFRDLEVPAASWHQKFWLFDDQVAYVGGMNTKSVDWDSHDHLIFDARRMDFYADTEDREAVLYDGELPDYGPRRDYMIRIDGPVVTDVDDVFHTRWEQALLTGAQYAEDASFFDPQPWGGDSDGELFAQLVATMPEPWAEMSILETQLKAVENAQSYIFIEDQYWRAEVMNDTLIGVLLERPWVKLIVVSKEVADYDGGAKYTYITDQLFRDLVPDQYLYLQLKSFDLYLEEGIFWDTVDLYFDPIDTHSKLMIVDDRYMSVGSSNKNNRGLLYDGELNVAVLDDVWVRAERERLFHNLVGDEDAHRVSDDADANFALFQELSESNADLEDAWNDWVDMCDLDTLEEMSQTYQPAGFLYPLQQGDNYWFDIGPDMF